MKVDVNSSSHSFPMETRDSDWRWGNMCYIMVGGIRRCFRLSSSICVVFIRLSLGSITWERL